IVKKIRQPIDKGLDKIVAWLGNMLKKLGSAVAQAGLPADPNERLRLGMQAAANVVNRFAKKKVAKALLDPLLIGIKTRYGLVSLELREKSTKWSLTGVVNPTIGIDTDAEVAGIVPLIPITPAERAKIASIPGGNAQLKKLDDIIAGGG